jgi:aromatic ring-cleaving dioxygenase
MTFGEDTPYHAHIYFAPEERAAAETLRARFAANPDVLFTGRMTEGPVGPHPIPQFEVHFLRRSIESVQCAIRESGLRALVHPLTDDDVADHTSLAEWIGEPLELDVTTLDPPGVNQGIPRFGKTDF